MALSSKELGQILHIITCDSSLSSNLDDIAISFHKDFNRSEHFKVGMSLITLLQNSELLEKPAERIAALYLLFEMYRSESFSVNPFAQLFHNLIQEASSNTKFSPEVYFISLITSPSARDIFQMTPHQIVKAANDSTSKPDIRHLRNANTSSGKASVKVTSGVGTIIPDKENDDQNSGEKIEVIENLVTGTHAASLSTLVPPFVRLSPPLYTDTNETLWLNPNSCEYTYEWEPLTIVNSTTEIEIRKFLVKALKGTLPQQQQNFIKEEISKNPKLIYHIGMTPSKLPALVENNSKIALEILLHLSQSNQLTEYFTVLVNMELSLHCMEVMNELLGRVVLPPEYIHLYITKCISHCENCKDRFVQQRFVRLVCVFLSSLIRNKIIDVKDLFIEVQAFCIDFSRIKEAAGLFRLLKQVDAAGDGAP